MRLTAILYAFVITALLVVITIFGVFAYRREANQFETDMRRDALILGHALSTAASDVWGATGEEGARRLVRNASGAESLIRVRFVTLDPGGNADRPWAARELLKPLTDGQDVSLAERSPGAKAGLYTYVPVQGPKGQIAALELYEPLGDLRHYTRTTAANIALMASALVVIAGIFVGFVGHRLVGRRMRELVNFARGIASGDLRSRLTTHGHDEVTEMGNAMNDMAQSLLTSQNNLVEETNKRVKAIEQLRHAERVSTLGQLSAGMAHELGTPLNVIAGRAKLIAARAEGREEIADMCRIISEQSERMTGIIRQLLNYGRRSKTQKARTRLEQLVGNALTLLDPSARKQQVTIEVKETTNLPMMMVDQTQIQQVVMNLATNAIQAMPGGGHLRVNLYVASATRPSGRNAAGGDRVECGVIRVQDSGLGISTADIQHVFDPFFSTKETGKGTGLGLSITRDIVEDHGGWIEVESEPDRGSCFSVYLPLEEPHE